MIDETGVPRNPAGIVGGHGGHVTAANADGGGAAFVVTLPAAAGAARYRVLSCNRTRSRICRTDGGHGA